MLYIYCFNVFKFPVKYPVIHVAFLYTHAYFTFPRIICSLLTAKFFHLCLSQHDMKAFRNVLKYCIMVAINRYIIFKALTLDYCDSYFGDQKLQIHGLY